MASKILHVFAVIVTVWAVGLLHVKGDVDCSQRPPHADPKKCCPVPNLTSGELMEKCRQMTDMPSTPAPEHGQRKHHRDPCFPSCIFNETGILVDEKLNTGNLEVYLNKNIGGTPEMIPILKELVEQCYGHAKEKMEKMRKRFENKEDGPPHGRCPPQAGMIMHCIMRKTFKVCPTSIWAGTEECNAARAYFAECKKKKDAE